MSSSVPLMADVEGFEMDESRGEDGLKNDFAYHNNVAGAAKHIRYSITNFPYLFHNIISVRIRM